MKGFGFEGSTAAGIVQNKLNNDGSRTLALTMAAVNGEYGLPGAPTGAIQGMFTFTISKDGVVGIDRTRSAVTTYPSWGVYSYETFGAQPRKLYEANEQKIEALKKAPVPLTQIK